MRTAEHGLREGRESADFWNRLIAFVTRERGQKPLLIGGDVAVHMGLRLQ